jgi:hypothetical protein
MDALHQEASKEVSREESKNKRKADALEEVASTKKRKNKTSRTRSRPASHFDFKDGKSVQLLDKKETQPITLTEKLARIQGATNNKSHYVPSCLDCLLSKEGGGIHNQACAGYLTGDDIRCRLYCLKCANKRIQNGNTVLKRFCRMCGCCERKKAEKRATPVNEGPLLVCKGCLNKPIILEARILEGLCSIKDCKESFLYPSPLEKDSRQVEHKKCRHHVLPSEVAAQERSLETLREASDRISFSTCRANPKKKQPPKKKQKTSHQAPQPNMDTLSLMAASSDDEFEKYIQRSNVPLTSISQVLPQGNSNSNSRPVPMMTSNSNEAPQPTMSLNANSNSNSNGVGQSNEEKKSPIDFHVKFVQAEQNEKEAMTKMEALKKEYEEAAKQYSFWKAKRTKMEQAFLE